MTVASQPGFDVPTGACDCHMHVFGVRDAYPLASPRAYTPRPATLGDYDRLAAALGLSRVVLVQPSVYGTDNSCMVDAMRGAGGRCRGVAAIDEGNTGDDELAALHAAGVRGVRLNAATHGALSVAEVGGRLEGLARRAGPLAWHVQLFAGLAEIEALAPVLAGLSVPVVIDHMGLARAEAGAGQPGFDVLLRLVAEGNCWVKLSGAYRVSQAGPGFGDTEGVARALIGANPERMVWGTDWPHTPAHSGAAGAGEPPESDFRSCDDGRLLGLLGAWTDGNAALIRRILVDNPAALYGF